MAEPLTPLEQPRVTLFVDRDRHRVLSEIQSFVENIHYIIDPDMFRIDERELTWMKRLLRGGQIGTTIRVSLNELFVMETIAMAAGEYTVRKSTPTRLNVTDEELDGLMEWIAQANGRLRSVEPTIQ